MKIKMLQTKTGADDGINNQQYKEGEIYEVGDDLGNSFIGLGIAERLQGEDVKKNDKAYTEKKALEGAPHNKAAKPVHENK